VVGVALLAVAVMPVAMGFWGEREAQQRWEEILVSPLVRPDGPRVELFRPVDGLDFKLTVPRLGYSEVVREGVGLGVLAMGPGHYPQTSWPGRPGAVGVAAHNLYWQPFGDLKPGDEVVLEARYGLFRYRITGSQVVSLRDGWILDPAPDRQLTLTTGSPEWAGQFATRRLAIFAQEELGSPD